MRRVLPVAAGLTLGAVAWASTLTPIQELGKNIFFDRISARPQWQSCVSCHDPAMGWTGAIVGINAHGGVYRGAEPQRFGNRKPPSSAYATFSPIFHRDAATGEFFGGNLWDGRATGERLGSPAADQALGPFDSPVEQNISLQDVCQSIAASRYARLFEQVWGPGSLDCGDPGYLATGDKVALSIAAYEASPEVNAFSSKYDAYWKACLEAGNSPEACGLAEGDKAVLDPAHILTEQEFDGLIEFGEYCSPCHVSHQPGPGGTPPLFTTHGFDNLGVPRNPANPVYRSDPGFVDLGLGRFLRTRPEWSHLAEQNDGKMKIPTVRNVDLRRGGTVKAYMHNGALKSLKEVVQFYNTRDVPAANWPPPEVDRNVNRELLAGLPLGDLQLDPAAEDAIVAFLGTLSDGWTPGRRPPRPMAGVNLDTPRFHLGPVTPNPTDGTFRVAFSLPDASPVRMTVFDVAGRVVASREVGTLGAGEHTVLVGSPRLSPGVYLVRLTRDGASFVTRAVVIGAPLRR